VAAIHLSLYREISIPVYRGVDGTFAWSNIWTNLVRDLRWMIETQTIVFPIGLAAMFLPMKRSWPFVPSRFVFVLFAICAVAGVVFYGAYAQVDQWLQLRELLVAWPFIAVGCAAVALMAIRASPAWGKLAVAWALAAVCAWTLHDAAARGAFARWRAEGRLAAVADQLRALTEEGSVVFGMTHSGTASYYGARTTLRFDRLDPSWLDRSVEWLASQGAPAYALLEDWEVPMFKRRFENQAAAARLDRSLVVRFQSDAAAQLYDLRRERSPLPPIVVTNTARFRFAPPALPRDPRFHAP